METLGTTVTVQPAAAPAVDKENAMAKSRRKVMAPPEWKPPSPAERLKTAAEDFARVASEVALAPQLERVKGSIRAQAMKAAHAKKGAQKG